mgnify:CR=1 FL=1
MSLLNLFVDVDDFCQAVTIHAPEHLLGHFAGYHLIPNSGY